MGVWAEKAAKNRWRVRWRNQIPIDPGSGLTLGGKGVVTVTGLSARDELVARVRRSIELEGFYLHNRAPSKAGSYGRAFPDWIAHKVANGASKGTRAVLRSAGKRICRDIRALERIADDDPIPVSGLTIDLATRLKAGWRDEGLSGWRIYDLAHYFLEAWRWAASQPERYPHTPTPPLSRSLILPPAPPRIRGQEPILAEVDAVCRRARASQGSLGAIVATLRLTGLRIGQVVTLRVQDVDLRRETLTVSTGKSLREKLERREVPLHPDLAEILRSRVDGFPPDRWVFAGRQGGRPFAPLTKVRALWEAATYAKECRRGVWEPVGRKARPNHAFRAAFLTALREAGVAEEVRKALVGHAETTTEQRHYSGVTLPQMREGLKKLPGIDWGESGPPAGTG